MSVTAILSSIQEEVRDQMSIIDQIYIWMDAYLFIHLFLLFTKHM